MNASSSSNPHSSLFQRTVAAVVELEGPGLLTGEHCRLRVPPAEPGTGRVFVRTDLEPAVEIPALVKFARRAERRTILELGEVRVQTVEHLLAALAGLEIDNVRIELDSTELRALMVPPKCSLKPFWKRYCRARRNCSGPSS